MFTAFTLKLLITASSLRLLITASCLEPLSYLARLFTVLVLVNTLKFLTCLYWGYLMKNYTLLAKFSTCLAWSGVT